MACNYKHYTVIAIYLMAFRIINQNVVICDSLNNKHSNDKQEIEFVYNAAISDGLNVLDYEKHKQFINAILLNVFSSTHWFTIDYMNKYGESDYMVYCTYKDDSNKLYLCRDISVHNIVPNSFDYLYREINYSQYVEHMNISRNNISNYIKDIGLMKYPTMRDGFVYTGEDQRENILSAYGDDGTLILNILDANCKLPEIKQNNDEYSVKFCALDRRSGVFYYETIIVNGGGSIINSFCKEIEERVGATRGGI